MFQLETEDMLPRMAPKPTAPTPTLGLNGDGGGLIQPQVPEVSILFGGALDPRQQQQLQQQSQQQQQPSYATWRKQVAKVTFNEKEPPECSGVTAGYPLTHGSYSMSSRSVTVSSIPSSATSAGIDTSNGVLISSNHSSYRNALPPVFYCGHDNPNEEYLLLPTSGKGASASAINHQPPCQPPLPVRHEVLTICAGTQTDASLEQKSPPTSNSSASSGGGAGTGGGQCNQYASKADVEQLMTIVENMREDQLRLMQICESLLGMSQQAQQIQKQRVGDAAIQCDSIGTRTRTPPHLCNGNEKTSMNGGGQVYRGGEVYEKEAVGQEELMEEVEEMGEDKSNNGEKETMEMIPSSSQAMFGKRTCPPLNPVLEQLKQQESGNSGILQTPKGRPVAQSTVYRITTPRTPVRGEKREFLRQEDTRYQATTLRNVGCNDVVPSLLPKPSTEKSLFMNELAIKYLPNEKLAELLQDMNVDVVPDTNNHFNPPPLKSVENFEKGSTDISNASYKYLKKYRLLPEDRLSAETKCGSNPTGGGGGGGCGGGQPLLHHHHGENGSSSPLYHRDMVYPPPPRRAMVVGNHHNGLRLPTSPLAQSPSSSAKAKLPKSSPLANNNMLDLGNIKRQPKLL